MLDDVIGYLACPLCGAALSRAGGVLRCASGHAFDIARQGYVSLLPAGSRGNIGDTAAMVQARIDFLAAGHYAGLAAELSRAAADTLAAVAAGAAADPDGAGGAVDAAADAVGAGGAVDAAADGAGAADDAVGAPADAVGAAADAAGADAAGGAAAADPAGAGADGAGGVGAGAGGAGADSAGAADGAGVADAVAGGAVGSNGSAGAGCVVDIGAGTGYYLAAVLEALPGRAGLALDASKFALRRAARAHQRIGAVGADAWQRLPVADRAATVVLNVFAPRDGAELRRILDPVGALLVVTPNPDHLSELVGPLRLLTVDPRKDERLAGKLSPYFDLAEQRQYHTQLALDHQEIATIIAMGPSARHVGDPAERIRSLPAAMGVTVSVTLSIFR
jgi:23S rRNA (guanine745-N1)-methyltransferase